MKLGIPMRFIHYTRNFLSTRKTWVEVNNARSTQFYLNEGLPQGSAISPLLFLIFINDIDADLHPSTVASLFADDTATWTQGGKDKERTAQHMQGEVTKIATWAETWKMSINADKTRTLIMSTSTADFAWDPKLIVQGAPIKTTKEYKFLGVTVDRGLRFTKHLDNTITKCTKRVNIIKCLAGKDWGQQLESQRRVYLTYVRSCLEYASPSWWPCIPNTSKTKLERVQNAAVRSIAGLYKTTPVEFLQLETNIEPITHRLDKLDIIHRDKYTYLPSSDTRRAMLNRHAPNRLITREGWSHSVMRRPIHEVTEDEQNIPLIPPWYHPNNLEFAHVELEKPKAEYTPAQLKEKTLQKILDTAADYTVYTDGSTDSKQEDGGAGIFVHDANNNTLLEKSEPAGQLCSSYGAEGAALWHALVWLRQNIPQEADRKRVLVCTDSRSLVDALKHVTWKDRDYWIIKIQQELPLVNCHVVLLWIPSHCDVDGNEKADKLAKAGSSAAQTNVPVSIKIRKAKIKNIKWQPSHPRATTIYGDKRSPKLEIERRWSRKIRSLYARLRTGHAKELQEYRHRVLEKEESPNCRECNVPEDTEHVLCHCNITEEARARNWSGEVTMDMLVKQPEICRKILASRFADLYK